MSENSSRESENSLFDSDFNDINPGEHLEPASTQTQQDLKKVHSINSVDNQAQNVSLQAENLNQPINSVDNQAQNVSLQAENLNQPSALEQAGALVVDAVKIEPKRKAFFGKVKGIFENNENKPNENKLNDLLTLFETDEAKAMAEKDTSTKLFTEIAKEVCSASKDPEDKKNFLKELVGKFSYLADEGEKNEIVTTDKATEMTNIIAACGNDSSLRKNVNFGSSVTEKFGAVLAQAVAVINPIVTTAQAAALPISEVTTAEVSKAAVPAPDPNAAQESEKVKDEKLKSFIEDLKAEDVAKATAALGTVIALSVVFPGVGTLIGLTLVGGFYAATSQKDAKPEKSEEEIIAAYIAEEAAAWKVKAENLKLKSNVKAATTEFVEDGFKEIEEDKNKLAKVSQTLAPVSSEVVEAVKPNDKKNTTETTIDEEEEKVVAEIVSDLVQNNSLAASASFSDPTKIVNTSDTSATQSQSRGAGA